MTAQSKVNIEAATDATLVPATGGGYQVKLKGKSGAEAFVENASGPITYSSMANAKTAVKTHNSNLNPALAPTI
jgi:hypothetical protein